MPIVCAIDPGTVNFGICVAEINSNDMGILHWEVIDTTAKTKDHDQEICTKIHKALECLKPTLNMVDVFLIEQQRRFAALNVKVAHFTTYYLATTFPDKKVISYSARYKTMPSTTKLNKKKDRKDFCINFCDKAIHDNSVFVSNDYMGLYDNSRKKIRENMADPFCMIFSYWSLKR